MKLLLIPASYPLSPDDHRGIFVQDQARLLAARHDVTVLVPRLCSLRSWLKNPSRPPPETICREGVREIIVDIANLSNRLHRITQLRWQSAMVAKALSLFPQNDGPDIVHAHFIQPSGRVALTVAKHYNATAVLTEHSSPFSVQTRPGWKRRETARVLAEMNGVAAVSPGQKADMLAEFPRARIDILGNVVDETIFTPAPATQAHPFRFLFVGGLIPQKSVHDLIEAASLLNKTGAPDWHIDIGGDGPLRTTLEAHVRRLNLGHRVTFLGHLSRIAVIAAIRKAHALVIPSKSESFGVAAIEAMACGLPVISTDCGGPSWLIEPGNGQLVPPSDPVALADAMGGMSTGYNRFDAQHIRGSIVGRFGRTAFLDACDAFYTNARARHPKFASIIT